MSIEFNPKAEMTYDFRGRLHGKKADYAAALTDLTKSLEVKPSIFAYADRAEIYEKMGDHARAIADYTKALELDPGQPSGWSSTPNAPTLSWLRAITSRLSRITPTPSTPIHARRADRSKQHHGRTFQPPRDAPS